MAYDLTSEADRFTPIQSILRDEAAAGEAERRVTDRAHRALVESGVLGLLRPRSLGGEEADLVTMIRAIRSISKADGSAGWCAMISGVYAAFAGLLPRAGAEEVYAEPVTVVAGALMPAGLAVRVPGGYRLTGRWPFGSNCGHADWFVGGAVVCEDGAPVMLSKTQPLVRLCFFRRSEGNIIDTWRTTGLKGTGSHDYACQDVFVPEHRAFWFDQAPTETGTFYRLPVVAAFGAAISAVTVGIAEHAIELFTELAPKKTPILSPLTLQAKANVHDRLGQAMAAVEGAIAYLERAASDAWAIAESGRRPTFPERGRLWLAATHAAHSCLGAIDALYTVAGSSSVYETGVIDRCQRDARTAVQHVMTQFVNYEIAGKCRLDLPVMDSIWSFDYRAGDPAG